MTLALSSGLVGLSLLVSGAVLLVRHAARLSAGLLVLAGGVLLGGAVVDGTTTGEVGGEVGGQVATALLQLGLLLLLPLALTTYPRLGRHAVDAVAVVLVLGAGLTAVAWGEVAVAGPAGVAVTLVVVAHLWWRLERGDVAQRRVLTWVAVAVGSSSSVVFVAAFALPDDTGVAAGVLALAVLGPACVVGVRRPDVVDVRGLVVSLVVALVGMVVYVATWVLLVSLLASLGLRDPSLGTLGLLGALTALGMHPLQRVLRASVDTVLFGTRPDPLGAATLVAHSMGEDPQEALDGIREVLVLPYVALCRPDGSTLVSGAPVPHRRTVPLGEGAGELVVGLRAGDLRLAREDQRVLAIVAPLLALLVRATDLTADLGRSRAASVTAREEERRRLRRDLHDGLGPRLSGLAFTTDAARNLLRSEPERADELLRRVRADTTAAIADVRGLVYGMRPPALDELGLVPSLRQHAEELRDRDGRVVRVRVSARDVPERLPAAVEVAAYRIATEALVNVARHSGSRTARMTVTGSPGALTVEVTDDGGARAPWRAGVGLVSMRERAAEVGGTLAAGPGDRGGGVRAVLPLGPDPSPPTAGQVAPH